MIQLMYHALRQAESGDMRLSSDSTMEELVYNRYTNFFGHVHTLKIKCPTRTDTSVSITIYTSNEYTEMSYTHKADDIDSVLSPLVELTKKVTKEGLNTLLVPIKHLI